MYVLNMFTQWKETIAQKQTSHQNEIMLHLI